jgi:hypothetical protein
MTRTRFLARTALLACVVAMVAPAACTTGSADPAGPAGAAATNTAGGPGGAGGQSGPGGAGGQGGPDGVWREFVACARSNGQANWPDAQVDAEGVATFPAVDGFETKSAFEAVRTACAAILDRLPPQANPYSEVLTPDQIAAMRRYVQCLRENGMPDAPEPDANGRFTDPPRYRQPEYQDAYNAARQACDPILLGAR